MLNWTKARKMLYDKELVSPTNIYGLKESLKVANNTFLERRGDLHDYTKPIKKIALRYYNTDVLIFTPTYIELNSGGYHTMSTSERMSQGPVHVGPSYKPATGWAVYLLINRPCYSCGGTKLREDYTGFDIATLPNKVKKTVERIYMNNENRYILGGLLEGDYFANEYDHVYRVVKCDRCDKNGEIETHDNSGHPFYDGIRVNSTGRRLMAEQPNKPNVWLPIHTRSGFTGRRRSGFPNSRKVIG